MHAAVVNTITTDLPTQHLPAVRKLPFLEELDLADPQFDRPRRIDLLLGIDVYNAIMLTGALTSPDRSLQVYNSIFGWIVAGSYSVKIPGRWSTYLYKPLQ